VTEPPHKRRRYRPTVRSPGRTVVLTAILLLVIVAMGLVAVSPLALSALDSGDDVDWNRLSDIGQTYGAVSAIIAAIALLGVAISLVIQSREASAVRKNARRVHHIELMRMAMDDPDYMACWGPYLTDSFAAERQYTYVNLVVAHWYAEYQVGEMSDGLLKATAISVFASAPGRHYWQNAAAFWRDNAEGRRGRRFHGLLDEAYREATRKPPSQPPVEVSRPAAAPAPAGDRRRVGLLATVGGGVVAVLVVRAIRRVVGRR
jgi:Family of unknown function (DUF6082)